MRFEDVEEFLTKHLPDQKAVVRVEFNLDHMTVWKYRLDGEDHKMTTRNAKGEIAPVMDTVTVLYDG